MTPVILGWETTTNISVDSMCNGQAAIEFLYLCKSMCLQLSVHFVQCDVHMHTIAHVCARQYNTNTLRTHEQNCVLADARALALTKLHFVHVPSSACPRYFGARAYIAHTPCGCTNSCIQPSVHSQLRMHRGSDFLTYPSSHAQTRPQEYEAMRTCAHVHTSRRLPAVPVSSPMA